MPVPSVDLLTRSHIFLVQAVDRLLAEEPELTDVIEVHLAGVLSPLDREIAERTSYCRLHGYLSHDESVALLRSSQLLFLPMHDLPQGTRAGLVPGKTYEYLGAGRPILAAVPDGDARDILAAAGNATICRPADVDALSRGIRDQIDKWRSGTQRSAAQRDVVARFERRRLTEQLADVLAAAEGAGRTLQLLSS